jgi:hypothetical protein
LLPVISRSMQASSMAAFQILDRLAHLTTIKKLNGWISVGYAFSRAN